MHPMRIWEEVIQKCGTETKEIQQKSQASSLLEIFSAGFRGGRLNNPGIKGVVWTTRLPFV
jgi:hypothetical protein